MQQTRKTLTVRTVPPAASAETPGEPAALLRHAIARKACVTAVYNRTAVLMAPRAITEKHGDLFLSAVVIERDGKPPRELKLGTFKLTGLTELVPSPRVAALPATLPITPRPRAAPRTEPARP